jgi:L-2,4-diaminobutyrate transaminase
MARQFGAFMQAAGRLRGMAECQHANLSLEDIDRRALMHPLTSIAAHQETGPIIYSDAHGVTIKGKDGRRMIDLGAGLWCVNVGYGRDELADAAAQEMRHLSYHHIFGSASNEPAIHLADRILGLFHEEAGAPDMARVFFGTSGSDANDTAYKLVRYYNNLRGLPRKKKVIARLGAYHGLTYLAAGLTGIPVYHKAFDVPLPGILHADCPHFYRFARDGENEEAFTRRMVSNLKDIIAREGTDTIAAFIAEPVMGTGGVLLPPAGYFEALQEVLEESDILFIADEVITGFGRLGSWFGTGRYNLRPDIVSLAKGVTSAYFPLSANVLSTRVWDVLTDASPECGPVMHGFTYSGHPVGCAVGLANISLMEREDMVANAAGVGAYLLEKLRERVGDHPYVGDVRGEGLMIAVEFVADKKARHFFKPGSNPHRAVARKAMDEGVLVRPLPFIEVTSFSPPLCITKEEADEGVERYARGLEAATGELKDLASQ